MDYQKAQHAIETRRKALQRRILELRLQMARAKEELGAAEREWLGLEQMRRGTEVAVGLQESPTPVPSGLTAHIRQLLAETPAPLTAVQIRDLCEAAGIRASSRRNLLIQVHTALKRMALGIKSGRRDGKRVYSARPQLRKSILPYQE